MMIFFFFEEGKVKDNAWGGEFLGCVCDVL